MWQDHGRVTRRRAQGAVRVKAGDLAGKDEGFGFCTQRSSFPENFEHRAENELQRTEVRL